MKSYNKMIDWWKNDKYVQICNMIALNYTKAYISFQIDILHTEFTEINKRLYYFSNGYMAYKIN